MSNSPFVEEAKSLLVGEPWKEPARCRQIIERLRQEGERGWADRLEGAINEDRSYWPGCTATDMV